MTDGHRLAGTLRQRDDWVVEYALPALPALFASTQKRAGPVFRQQPLYCIGPLPRFPARFGPRLAVRCSRDVVRRLRRPASLLLCSEGFVVALRGPASCSTPAVPPVAARSSHATRSATYARSLVKNASFLGHPWPKSTWCASPPGRYAQSERCTLCSTLFSRSKVAGQCVCYITHIFRPCGGLPGRHATC